MEKLTTIVQDYVKVIAAWKNRSDVQNGEALAYRKNQDPDGEFDFLDKPTNLGEGTTTTGFCVSVSQNFIFDKIFNLLLQDRGAIAKLISIDIKEQFYGRCYTGTKNKWHTAILVKDSNINFVIDLTCGQFGNAFVGKEIWAFETWEKTFRSPNDKHNILDFEDKHLGFLPIPNIKDDSKENKYNIENSLYDITTITDDERVLLTDFFASKKDIINKKILIGNITDFDFRYMNQINKLLNNFSFISAKEQYHIIEFNNKDTAKNWIKKLIENESDGGYILPHYMVTSKTIKDNCDYLGVNFNQLNTESLKDKSYVVFKINSFQGFDISMIKNANIIIPYGIKLMFNPSEDIYNGGVDISRDIIGGIKKTNTIVINCDIY